MDGETCIFLFYEGNSLIFCLLKTSALTHSVPYDKILKITYKEQNFFFLHSRKCYVMVYLYSMMLKLEICSMYQ